MSTVFTKPAAMTKAQERQTLEACDKSIARYHKLSTGPAKVWVEAELGRYECALCDLFNGDDPANFLGEEAIPCEGCPVSCKTGFSMCSDTPYAAMASPEEQEVLADAGYESAIMGLSMFMSQYFGSPKIDDHPEATEIIRDHLMREAKFLVRAKINFMKKHMHHKHPARVTKLPDWYEGEEVANERAAKLAKHPLRTA